MVYGSSAISRAFFTAVAHELPQQIHVLVVDVVLLVSAELAELALGLALERALWHRAGYLLTGLGPLGLGRSSLVSNHSGPWRSVLGRAAGAVTNGLGTLGEGKVAFTQGQRANPRSGHRRHSIRTAVRR